MWRAVLNFACLLCSLATSAEPQNFTPVGEHHLLFRFYKNENPQNLMVVYAKLNTDCTFQTEGGDPVLGVYWLMDGSRFKPVHSIIQKSIRKHVRYQPLGHSTSMSHEFAIVLPPDPRLSAELNAARMVVKSRPVNQTCKVEAFFPNDDNSIGLFTVESLIGESRKIFIPPFRKLVALTIRGVQLDGTTSMQRHYLLK